MAVQKYRERVLKNYLLVVDVKNSDMANILTGFTINVDGITSIPPNPIVVDTYKMYYEDGILRIYGHDNKSVSVRLINHATSVVSNRNLSTDLLQLHRQLTDAGVEVFVVDNDTEVYKIHHEA